MENKKLNNLKNLKNRTIEERRAIAKKGAKASAQTKREKKIIKEEILNKLNAEDMEEIVNNLIERAKSNDNSFITLRDTIGQKPSQELNLTTDSNDFEFIFKYSK